MNWKTLGDGTSLFVYDLLVHGSKLVNLPLWFIPMWTMPKDKYIIVPKTNRYRLGGRNDKLVKLMRMYLHSQIPIAKKLGYCTGESEIKEAIRLQGKEGGAKIYASKYIAESTKKTSVDQKELLSWDFAKSTINLANYFRSECINMKMLYKSEHRHKNTFNIKGLQSFTDMYRDEYFNEICKFLRKHHEPCIVFLDPDVGILEAGTRVSKGQRNGYLMVDDLKKISDSIHNESIIIVKHTLKNYRHNPKRTDVFDDLKMYRGRYLDSWFSAGIYAFSKEESVIEKFFSKSYR